MMTMRKKRPTGPVASIDARLPDNFWLPSNVNFSAEADEFSRVFGLRPELAEALGVRQFLREDTLKTVN
jgi:hypothetical protein